MSKVTAIVATRNRPDFLFRCLLAIKLQTFEDFECIVVGDNCNFSEAVFREFQNDQRFTYYKFVGDRPKNQGSIAKNIAMDLSRSKYIAYCDDDNVWLPSHLRILYSEMGVIDAAYSKFYHIDYDTLPMSKMLEVDMYDISKAKVCPLEDALTMMHENNTVRWTPKAKLGMVHEDTDFMRRFNSSTVGKSVITDVTAIYNQHNFNSVMKDHSDYTEALFGLNGQTYVYPDLVAKIKEKYWR